MKEIERRYIVLDPNFIRSVIATAEQDKNIQKIIQFYHNDIPIRLRKVNFRDEIKYYQTIKIGTGVIRDEFEIELTHSQYNSLLPLVNQFSISKNRIIYERKFDETIMIDIYDMNIDIPEIYSGQLVIAEVEFDSLSVCNNYNFPIKHSEVTYLISNRTLAVNQEETLKLISTSIQSKQSQS